eukprot:12019215-Alexandrium_andersonii.AAC.1
MCELTGFSLANVQGVHRLQICGLAAFDFAISRLRTPRPPFSLADSEAARNMVSNAPLGSSGNQLSG